MNRVHAPELMQEKRKVSTFWTKERDAELRSMSKARLCPAVMAMFLGTTERMVLLRRSKVGCQAAPRLRPRTNTGRVGHKKRKG